MHAYQKKALSLVPTDDENLDERSTSEPNSLAASVQTLVQRYEKSLPSYCVKDHLLIDMLRRYTSGHFNTLDNILVLHAQLTYRLRVYALAMHIVRKLDLWKGAAIYISDWNPDVPEEHADYRTRTLIVGQLQQNTGWFKPKRSGDGQYYKKPMLCLARALEMQGYQHGEQVLEWIERAKEMLKGTLDG